MLVKLIGLLLLRLAGANSPDGLPPLDFYEVKVFDGDLHQRVLDPELCQEHLREMSSFEFYDASFRVPQGLLQGNTVDFGNYFQCLQIDQELSETNHIYGKHCIVTLQNISVPEIEMPWAGYGGVHKMKYGQLERMGLGRTAIAAILTNIRLGICIPAACTPSEAIDRLFNDQLIGINYETQLCRLPRDRPRVAADYIAIVVFSLIGLVTVISTGYDVRHTVILKQDPKQLDPLYSCASIYSNTRRLLTFNTNPGVLSCIDGIRSLSIMWIILGHSVLSMLLGGVQNMVDMGQWYASWEAVWLQATEIGVDSFFMMSGLLLVYTTAHKLSRGGLMKSLHLFYLNRLLRMFPILATAVLLQASLLNRLGDGANWQFQGLNVEYCRRHWWAALLHIQNYYNSTQMCLPHAWYLAVDIQLHILSPLVLFWVLGGRRGAWAAVVLALCASLAGCVAYIFLVVSQPDKAYKLHYYENTLTRAPPFFVGLLYGYVLHIFRNKKLRLTTAQVMLGWLAALAFLVGAVCSFYPSVQDEFESQTYMNLFNSFTRTFWALGLGWVIAACAHGYGGPINWFLSLTMFKFLARLSYAMYLLHYQIQFIRTAAITRPFYFSLPNALLRYVTELSLTILVSVVATVVIDMPFSTVQKMLFGGGKQKQGPKRDCANEETKPKNNGFVRDEAR